MFIDNKGILKCLAGGQRSLHCFLLLLLPFLVSCRGGRVVSVVDDVLGVRCRRTELLAWKDLLEDGPGLKTEPTAATGAWMDKVGGLRPVGGGPR